MTSHEFTTFWIWGWTLWYLCVKRHVMWFKAAGHGIEYDGYVSPVKVWHRPWIWDSCWILIEDFQTLLRP